MHLAWDNTDGWDSQLFVTNATSQTGVAGFNVGVRHQNGGTWTGWIGLIDTSNIGSQSVAYATTAGSATDSTKVPLDGTVAMTGTLTVGSSQTGSVSVSTSSIQIVTPSLSTIVLSRNTNNRITVKVGTGTAKEVAYLDDITGGGGAVDSVCGYTGDVTAADIGSALQGEGYELTDSNTARLRVGNVNNKTICTTENTNATIQFTGGTDGFTVSDGRYTFTVPVTTTGTTYSQGTGISISGTTISMSSTYRTYCSNGNTAYGWGNHANAGYASASSLSNYLPLSGGRLTNNLFIDTNGGERYIDIAGHSNERFLVGVSDQFYVWGRTNGHYINCLDGKVSIRSAAYTYTLNVNGGIGATGFNNTSDVRKKDIQDYYALVSVDTIANAPAVRFKWKEGEDKSLHCGTLAQYWDTVMPECVTHDNQGYLSMQYDVIALLAAISIAKKVINHEERIAELERENKELKKKLQELCQ